MEVGVNTLVKWLVAFLIIFLLVMLLVFSFTRSKREKPPVAKPYYY